MELMLMAAATAAESALVYTPLASERLCACAPFKLVWRAVASGERSYARESLVANSVAGRILRKHPPEASKPEAPKLASSALLLMI